MLRFAASKVTAPCHSEERSDEESAFATKNRRSRFLSRACGIGMTGGTFIPMGGPKAHVTLSMRGPRTLMRIGGPQAHVTLFQILRVTQDRPPPRAGAHRHARATYSLANCVASPKSSLRFD